VDSIVGQFRTSLRALHRELGDAYETRSGEILMDTRNEIMAVLNQEQRVAYDSLLAEADRRREERRRDSTSGSGSGRNRDQGNDETGSDA
jgi:hypothetical protein